MERRDRLRVLAGRWEYDLDDELPGGANAKTYGGRDLARNGEEIVVKLLDNASSDGRARERFEREAKLHAQLEHDAILPLLAQGGEGDDYYIVTPRLRPGSLWNVVEPDRPLGPAKTRAIGARIASALEDMHSRNEIHGDISPGNVLCGPTGDAFLADFGFSKRVSSDFLASSGDRHGTDGFAAPRKVGEARTSEDDVFSLAAVLWFCLTGHRPSRSAAVRKRQLPDRTLRSPLERALRWEEERIPTAAQLATRLESGWATSREDWREAASRRRRARLPLLAAAGLLVLVLAALAGQLLPDEGSGAGSTEVARQGVTLRLAAGDWARRKPPVLPGFRIVTPVAAGNGRTTVVAGRAPSAGVDLISRAALSTLPREARRPRAVAVGGRATLRYGPASRFGGAIEVFAIPLENKALVVRCTGPVDVLAGTCSAAAASVAVESGEAQPLAPNAAVGRRLRFLASRFDGKRVRIRSRLAEAKARPEVESAAARLAQVARLFARALDAVPTTAQDGPAVRGTADAARRVGSAYDDLASADAARWPDARAVVTRREEELEAAVRRLGRLPVYT